MTLRAADMDTVQDPVPLQAPPQPLKVASLPGTADNVTDVPGVKFAEHVEPQLIPDGELETVPLPLTDTLNAWTVAVVSAKVAVADRAALMVTVQVPLPVQPLLQPEKDDPLLGVAVRTTVAPLAKLAEQVDPQLMPEGELVTVPPPTPSREMVSVGRTVPCVKLGET